MSLLSICGTAYQRRLLRTQGMAKTIVDAVLGLNLDDSASNLAAACLLYLVISTRQRFENGLEVKHHLWTLTGPVNFIRYC
ncbi:hypothetical protein F8388_023522 [Cannabis sativa]|uniref:Uncharacterized protein n=1 Tax=Cannabis sativa TaxID=3483 RepID=A0A7J6GN98_CANSA|nr:hypothetical protein F8388_023522 [Cannabis sativa]